MFRPLQKSVFTSNHVDLNHKLHFYSCLVLSRLCMRCMIGRHRGLGGPATAELLDVTGQKSVTQLLSRHRVRWLGHAARKPETTMVKQLLFA